jgi:ABC-type multidrug transport system ATPase subunit
MSTALANPVLSVQGLDKRYTPDRTALARVDLTASRGGIVGLLGANGAAKTTLVGLWATGCSCLLATATG